MLATKLIHVIPAALSYGVGMVVLTTSLAAYGEHGSRPATAGLPAWPVIQQRDMDEAAKKVRLPADGAPAPSSPRMTALPHPQMPLDLQAVARAMEHQRSAVPVMQARGGLLILVSFSVPETSMRLLVDQAERTGAVLTLRGYDQGRQATMAKVQKLVGQRKVSFQIDPEAFTRFDVKQVPSFVLMAPSAGAVTCAVGMCLAKDEFVTISGDVSLDYALEQIERLAPAFAKQARALNSKLKG